MKEGQRPDGGWSKDDGPSDLATSYRVMRAFFMLKEAPDLDALRKFIAGCRQSDGGYSSTPDGAADPSGTLLRHHHPAMGPALAGEPPSSRPPASSPSSTARTSTAGRGTRSSGRPATGCSSAPRPASSTTTSSRPAESYGDFILKLTFRLVGGEGNSGVQFRSVRVPGHEMSGYQADIGQDYWGCLYDESRRNRVLVQASPKALEALNKTGGTSTSSGPWATTSRSRSTA